MAGDRIGCGILSLTNEASAIYFVRNGIEIGRMDLDPDMSFPFATITSSHGAMVAFDCKPCPPRPALSACLLQTAGIDVLDTVTGEWRAGKKVGKEGPRGVPVLFEGSDVLHYAKAGEVKPSESGAIGNRRVSYMYCGLVFFLENPKLVSVGSAALRISAPGVVLDSLSIMALSSLSSLTMKNVEVRCPNGSAVCINDTGCHGLQVDGCRVGPCGRHGIVLSSCAEEIIVKNSTIEKCAMIGVAANDQCKANFMNLNISGCNVGIHASGATFKVSETTIKDCKESAVRVFWNQPFNAQKIRLETCTIEKCFRPIVAEGKGLEIVVPSSCIIEGCSLKNETKGGAVIDWKNDPDPPVLVEAFTPQDNFSRYMKLMLGLGTEVLVKVLRKCYKSRTGKNWNHRTGREIASRMNDYQRSRLGKAMLERLKEDEMDSWDITLLSALLVNNPGYMDSSSLERAVESLRDQRNEFVHSGSFKDLSMDHGDFRSK
ncbi:hypothetical protein GUITHDRAFT_122848, partial [Guillardia theta CCMP2712]